MIQRMLLDYLVLVGFVGVVTAVLVAYGLGYRKGFDRGSALDLPWRARREP